MKQIDRRTVIGAAWAAPVVLMAVGSPASAASTPEQFAIAWVPTSVKVGENVGVQVQNQGFETAHTDLTLQLTTSDPFFFTTVDLNGWTSNGSGTFFWSAPIQSLDITGTLTLTIGQTREASLGTLDGTLLYSGGTVESNALLIGTASSGNQ